jgi:anti-sigma-K factor RskA
MDYSRPDLADRLAAEYVLGTLRGPARRRMQALLPAHPALRAAVEAWERRLLPMADAVRPVAPRAEVWQRVQGRLFADAATARPAARPSTGPASPTSFWQRLALWRGATGLAFAAMFGMAVLLGQRGETPPPIVIVLGANPDAASGMQPARFVASVGADGRSLVLKPIDVPSLTPAKALELWAVPAQGAPRSLGLVSPDRGATVLRAGLLQGTAAFAVSLEPAGGSPTGAPTGPILSVGKVQI